VLGLVSVFLALGTATLIASVASVPDEETASLMADLHSRLVRGASAAVALAGAQEAAGADGAALAASSGFVCFGARPSRGSAGLCGRRPTRPAQQ
jgi:CHAT domain